MQIPASNLLPDRPHRFVGNSRTEIDEELPPSDSSISSAETCSPENRTSRSDMSFACHHPCNRRSSSSPDEAPARTPSNARLWPPVSPALLPLSCNARWAAAPLFALTCLYASQTSHFEITNGFASLIGSS